MSTDWVRGKGHLSLAALAVPVFTFGCVLGYFLKGLEDRRVVFSAQREEGYRYINPLLECEASSEYRRNRELSNFRQVVAEVIEARLRASDAKRISVYFRELQDGLRFTIGEQGRFSPASLLKVPLLIAYLKMAEREPGLLGKSLRYEGGEEEGSRQNFKPSQTLVPGREYTIDDLLRRAIIHSDNRAAVVLRRHVEPRVLYREYQVFGITDPNIERGEENTTISENAAFFRILYNATYLSRADSEKALALLAEEEFKGGLLAGVPPGVAVAHKFGERSFGAAGDRQLHDCGIVYYPRHPYLLCVMSRGEDFERLARSIADVSRAVFAGIEAQQGGR